MISAITKHTLTLSRPFQIIAISFFFGIITILKLLLSFNIQPFFSWKDFQQHWFTNFWSYFGPLSTAGDAVATAKIVGTAYGVILDLGPGSGLTVGYLDPTKIVRAYGVEPCVGLHPELRQHIAAAGLESVYEILPVGAEALGKYGIEKESVDTVVCCKVVCGIPQPEVVLKELYGYLKPGGQFVVYEHVMNQKCYTSGLIQRVLQLVWPHMLQGCNLTRKTDDMLRTCGAWETVELQSTLETQTQWDLLPFVRGRLVKARK